MQGPLSSPKRISEPSGWFPDGWVQAQRSHKSLMKIGSRQQHNVHAVPQLLDPD